MTQPHGCDGVTRARAEKRTDVLNGRVYIRVVSRRPRMPKTRTRNPTQMGTRKRHRTVLYVN